MAGKGAPTLKQIPFATLATAAYLGQLKSVKVDGDAKSDVVKVTVPDIDASLSDAATAVALAKKGETLSVVGVDDWIAHADKLLATGANPKQLNVALTDLDVHLHLRTYVAGCTLSLSDFVLWAALRVCEATNAPSLKVLNQRAQVKRWYGLINASAAAQAALEAVGLGEKRQEKTKKTAAEKKFGKMGAYSHELKGAEHGKVCTRFPPEPSGYLHVGHIKAALLNNHYAKQWGGKLLVRFDDTNPNKEKTEYADAILEDLATMEIVPHKVSHTSDHFDLILSCADKLIENGTCYVDPSPYEELKKLKFERKPSRFRDQPIEENKRLWEEMKAGSPEGVQCVMRGKIDYASEVGSLRDPSFYRCNITTPHIRTGFKYKLYPLYDFACPIVDSKEGVTHALRSAEYHDRIALYNWVLKALNLRHVEIMDFARLNFANTVLSKRKLQWFVDNGKVSGWDSAAFPTVRGILRRGMTVKTLSEYVLSQGVGKSSTNIDMTKLWTILKKEIDMQVPRYSAVLKENAVTVTLANAPETEAVSFPKHGKNKELGSKVVYRASKVLMDQADGAELQENEEITLKDWGNCIIRKITRNADNIVTDVEADLHLEGDVKTTKKKITWVAHPSLANLVTVELQEFGNLITKERLEPDDDFEKFANPQVTTVHMAWADPNLRLVSKGTRIQLERKGYYIVDRALVNDELHPVLFMLP